MTKHPKNICVALLITLFSFPLNAGVFEKLLERAKNAHAQSTWHALFSRPSSVNIPDGNVLLLTMRNWRTVEYFGQLIAGHNIHERGQLVRRLAQEHEPFLETLTAAAQRFELYADVIEALRDNRLSVEEANQITHLLLRTDNREPCELDQEEEQALPTYQYNLQEHEVDLMRAFAQRLSFDFGMLALLFGVGRCQEYTALLAGAVRDAGIEIYAAQHLRFRNLNVIDRRFVNDHVVLRFQFEQTGEQTIYDPWLGIRYPMAEIRPRLRAMLNAATLTVTAITLAKEKTWLP